MISLPSLKGAEAPVNPQISLEIQGRAFVAMIKFIVGTMTIRLFIQCSIEVSLLVPGLKLLDFAVDSLGSI